MFPVCDCARSGILCAHTHASAEILDPLPAEAGRQKRKHPPALVGRARLGQHVHALAAQAEGESLMTDEHYRWRRVMFLAQ